MQWLIYFIASLLLGIGTYLGTAATNLFIINFITFPILIYMLEHLNRQTSYKFLYSITVAFNFGFGFYIIDAYNLYSQFAIILMPHQPNLVWPLLEALGVYLLPFFLSIMFVIYTWNILRPIIKTTDIRVLVNILIFSVSYVILEYIKTNYTPLMPWHPIGFSLIFTNELYKFNWFFTTNQLNFLALNLFCLPALLVYKSYKVFLSAFLSLLLILTIPIAITKVSNVKTVQPNLNINITGGGLGLESRLNPTKIGYILTYYFMSLLYSDYDVAVWPEGINGISISDEITKNIAKIAKEQKLNPILLGLYEFNRDNKVLNNVVLVTNNNEPKVVRSKATLIPIFEEGIVKSKEEGNSSFVTVNNVNILPLICYEALNIDSYSSIKFNKINLITVSSDYTALNQLLLNQNMHQLRIMASYFKTPLALAANNGNSALIDSYGNIIKRINPHDAAVVELPAKPTHLIFSNHLIDINSLYLLSKLLFSIYIIVVYLSIYYRKRR